MHMHACGTCALLHTVIFDACKHSYLNGFYLATGTTDVFNANCVQDEEEEASYEDLIQYLTDSTFPSTATPHQQLRIKQQSESFCIISGSLHYSKDQKRPAGSDASEPLQVLFSESLKHAAIQDAHIGRCLEFVDSHENSQLSVVTVSVLSALP